MVISILFSGFCLWVFERPLKEVSGQDFSYSNSFWNAVVTMTTVGYGEIYPKTNWGRFIGIIICFWGVLIVSIFVVSLTNLLTLSPAEEKTYTLLVTLKRKEQLKWHATYVLQAAYWVKRVNWLRASKWAKGKDVKMGRKEFNSIWKFRKQMLKF